MFTTSTARRFIGALPSLLLAAMALVIARWPAMEQSWQFDRTRILAGQWYRLLLCHVTHFGVSHLVWDVAVLLGLGSAASLVDGKKTWVAILLSMAAIPILILVGQPSLQTYRGLSGIDCALFALLAMLLLDQSLRDGRRMAARIVGLGLIGFIAKTGYEFLTGHTLFVDQSAGAFVPVPLAHAVGAVCGVIASRLPHGSGISLNSNGTATSCVFSG